MGGPFLVHWLKGAPPRTAKKREKGKRVGRSGRLRPEIVQTEAGPYELGSGEWIGRYYINGREGKAVLRGHKNAFERDMGGPFLVHWLK
jgi:hypothetical protein